jgi:3-hydroxyacyl-CoA dehydrogenase
MSSEKRKTVGIVGCGTIGASWAACFLGRGCDVRCYDPADGAEDRLRQAVARDWPTIEKLGLATGASQERLSFFSTLAEAMQGVEFVQESIIEDREIKRDFTARIDAVLPPEVIIASSSSGLMASLFQDAASHPERVLIGHPFNPPHLIPLVEVVGGKLTSQESVEKAMAFYRSVGKKPIHVRKEMSGHAANRLQAAVLRESMYLVSEGVLTAAEVDCALTDGPGLRWALTGPFLTMHLGGGDGGVRHLLEHLGTSLGSWWETLGQQKYTEELHKKIVGEVEKDVAKLDMPSVVEERDKLLLELLEMRAAAKNLP